MKKLFIGLLILAAGTGMYFFVTNKTRISEELNYKTLIVGKWKLDSINYREDSIRNGLSAGLDSLAMQYTYELKENGTTRMFSGDSLMQESSVYEWKKDRQLVWKDSPADTSGTTLTVLQLDKNKLIVLTNDSSRLVFNKLR